MIANLIYDCCFGLKRQPERKSTREIVNDLKELAEEELGRVLSFYTHKPKLFCC